MEENHRGSPAPTAENPVSPDTPFDFNNKDDAASDLFAQLAEDREPDDLFDQLGQDKDAVTEKLAEHGGNEVQELAPEPTPEAETVPVALVEAEPAVAAENVLAPAEEAEKDFGDLLAEFEAANEMEPEEPMGALEEKEVEREQLDAALQVAGAGKVEEDQAIHEIGTAVEPAGETTQEQSREEAPMADSALFSGGANDSGFDAIFAQAQREPSPEHPHDALPRDDNWPSPPPAPSLSIEHTQATVGPSGLGITAPEDTPLQSLLADTSDWLGGNSPEGSFEVGDGEEDGPGDENANKKVAEIKPEPLAFEVPQGWFDENEEWHWYTDEEREQVRLTMLGEGGWDQPEETPALEIAGLAPALSPGVPRSPSLFTQAAMSENAARRTPQPESQPVLASPAYDAYAPPSAQHTASSAAYSPYGRQSTNSSSPYAPSSYDPYAPIPQQPNPYAPAAKAAPSPYAPAPAAPGYGPSGFAGPAAVKEPPKPRPQPQRVASNAYDPPFLKPQKSFVRPVAATPLGAPSPFGVPPVPSPMSPPQAAPTAPPPPPTGPPRRPKGDSRPPSRGPVFAAPPPQGISRPPSAGASAYGKGLQGMDQSFGVPPRPPSSSVPPRPPSASEGRRSSYEVQDAYSPPPQLLAHGTPFGHTHAAYEPPRPPSAASSRGFTSSQASAPPSALAPPRPSSRGPPSRKASPLYEAPPPMPRPDVTQRNRPMPANVGPGNMGPGHTPPMGYTQTHEQRRPSYEVNRQYGNYGEDQNDEYERHQPTRESHQLSPLREEFPVLSRRYDEDEDDEDGEEQYRSQSLPPRQPQAQGQPEQGYQHAPYRNPPHQAPASAVASPPSNRQPLHDPYAPSSHESEPRDVREAPRQQDTYGTSPYAPQPPHQAAQQASYGQLPSPPAQYQQRQASQYSSYSPYEPAGVAGSGAQSDPYAPTPAGVSRAVDIADDPYASGVSPVTPKKQPMAPPPPPSQPSRSVTSSYDPPPIPRQPSRASTTSYDPSPYTPAKQQTAGMPKYGDQYARTASPAHSVGFGQSPPSNNYFMSQAMGIPRAASAPEDSSYVPQQVLEQRPVSEDPLGRVTLAARNTPIAVFGIGGVLITAFPGAAETESDGFHKGHSRAPSYGYASGRGQLWIRNISEVAAPAALKSDSSVFPGPLVNDPSTPRGAAGEKKKREAVLAYLDSRSEEIEKGLPYLMSSANRARREEEGKLVLVRILRAMILGEGKLSGNPQVEDAIRTALSSPSSAFSTAPSARSLSPTASLSTSLYPPSSSSSAAPIAATRAQLSHLSYLLAQGQNRDAAMYSADQGLWSHAMVISSSVDAELWKEVVDGFVTAELHGKEEGTAGIKASYTLIGGMSTDSIDVLVKAASITDDPSKDQWREVVASVLFYGKPTDLGCFDELGSRFMSLGLVSAAHACFLLSPLSPFLDTTPASYDRGIMLTQNARDEDAVIFAEIAEYARSLVPIPKGQELPVGGLPQLLPYKLARAWRLAELGEVELAQKYCAAIEAGAKPIKATQTQSVLPPAFTASLEDLYERLTGTPSIDPTKGLGSGRKSAKPGIDKIGSWIGGRITTFIAGEEEGVSAPKPPAADGKVAGPFSKFSSISPNASGSVSRTPSLADVSSYGGSAANGFLGVQPASRSASPSQYATHHGQTSHPSSSSGSSYGEQYGQHPGVGSGFTPWGADAGAAGEEEGGETPHGYGAGKDMDDGEFINPMAQLSLGPSAAAAPPPAKAAGKQPQQNVYDLEDDEDLGFGNSSLSRGRTPKPGEGDEKAGAAGGKEKEEAKKTEAAPAAKPEPAKGSWLGKLWGKKEGGPVRANLGEESSMVFDPDLKKWVVKGAKGEATVPSAPAPPPRAQTASPSRSAPHQSAANRAMSATPPPSQLGARPPPGGAYGTFPRSAGAPPPMTGQSGAGFAEGPDGGIRRMKSNLATSHVAPPPGGMSGPHSGPPSGLPSGPHSGPPSRPPTSAATPSLDDLLSRPPSKRPASAMKKGARNRYVDVFQGEGS